MDSVILWGLAIAALIASALFDRKKTVAALKKGWKAFEGLLPQLIVVLALVSASLAVLDTRTISSLIGGGSGLRGILIAALLGSVTLIPGFVAFPAAAALLAQGAGVGQIAAFVSTLMMVGVVTLPVEFTYFGKKAALMRNGFAFLFSFAAAAFVGWAVSL